MQGILDAAKANGIKAAWTQARHTYDDMLAEGFTTTWDTISTLDEVTLRTSVRCHSRAEALLKRSAWLTHR
jgi:hypothetical protein